LPPSITILNYASALGFQAVFLARLPPSPFPVVKRLTRRRLLGANESIAPSIDLLVVSFGESRQERTSTLVFRIAGRVQTALKLMTDSGLSRLSFQDVRRFTPTLSRTIR
jgi:hypothetical protein